MTLEPALNERGVELYHAKWTQLAELVRERGGVDTMLVDAPYSSTTHAGHNSGAASANRPTKANGVRDTGRKRRAITYAHWTAADVDAFVDAWVPLVHGWFVTITDDVLARAWRSALALHDLQTFAPLPLVETGGTVRLVGDGPSSWTTWIVVARPRTKLMSKWGTLPGSYVVPAERKPVVGGKPIAAIRALVRDYSRPGDAVVDPCCGGGTVGLGCIPEGRLALLGDADADAVEETTERLRSVPAAPRGGTLALPWEKTA